MLVIMELLTLLLKTATASRFSLVFSSPSSSRRCLTSSSRMLSARIPSRPSSCRRMALGGCGVCVKW